MNDRVQNAELQFRVGNIEVDFAKYGDKGKLQKKGKRYLFNSFSNVK